MAHAKKRSRLILTALALLLVGGGLAAAFWPRPTLVDLGEVRRGAMQVTIAEEGRTRVRDTYIVSTPLAGRLQRVELEPGDPVERGQTIVAHMLPTNPAALDVRTREQARAAVNAAQAALLVARADLNAAVASRDLAESELDRTRRLAEREIASAAALDQAKRTFRVSAAEVETAEAAIAMRQADLANAQAELISFDDMGLAAALDGARNDDIPLVAPASGRVLQVIQQSETTLPAGAPVIEIGDVRGDLEIVVDLLSTDAVQVSVGDPVRIEDWGGADVLDGEVSRIDPFGVTEFSALGVEEQRVNTVIQFTSDPDTFDGLGHGFRVEAQIVVWQAEDTLIVPASALFRTGTDWAVFVAENGTAQRRIVEIGRNNGIEAELLSDLPEGMQVVLYPSAGLEDGARVAQRTLN
ncbi:efflux RND transporter periplasmic adaptor subunit [Thalassococcus sp. S3]|uniref:efflux RND transporter periplasmic adaptor subunit n=1 Tax=Thalassococcus sp. S3 TaxID=2017482 RepID=UPI0010247A61|nr:HlyD family efflux transporter periplasmic adaptor subunit [Thalassococcus sp. S3]QBF30361.1 RND transporter [Thalassococcus sp. S3]